MWTFDQYTYMSLLNISFQNHGHQYRVGPPSLAVKASTLLGKLPSRFWSVSVGICAQIVRRFVS